MKIQSSNVNMASHRDYYAIYEQKSASIVTTDAEAATIELSGKSGNLIEQLDESKSQIMEARKERAQENLKKAFERINNRSNEVSEKGEMQQPKSEDEVQLEILKRMMEVLKRLRGGNVASASGQLKQLQAQYKNVKKTEAGGYRLEASVGNVSSRAVTGWTRTTVKSAFFAETENTCYQARGVVKTADGREISFGVDLEMSRSFCAKYESMTQEEYICTDPLVINLDTNIGSVSDQKFLFDLDSDGEEELISFAGEGSGFLALDKNGDGKINDGSELFGTKSGNGFADLAAYDEDGNGWIDENDAIFKDLKIWTKDAQGNNKLIDLGQAGVGAIYLGYSSTQFSLNETETNHTNGIIRSTGVFLKENGGAGTIQHIDLTL